MNNVSITANLTKDVELRYTPQGTAVATLSLAINSGFGDKQETCFINATVWKTAAENAQKYLHKGSKIALTGSLKQRSWQDQQGNRKSIIEINAHMIDYLDPKGASQAHSAVEDAFGGAIDSAFEVEEEVIIPGEEEMF